MSDQEEATGYRDTCGSAERMYAESPDRDRSLGEPYIPRDAAAAAAFERLVSTLEPDLRLAWHIKHGFRPRQEGVTEEWINEHYSIARVKLLTLWLRRSR